MADGSVKIDIEADGSDAKKELKDVEQTAQQTGDGLEETGRGAGKARKDFNALTVAAGTLVADGLKSVISGAVNTVAGLLELSDSTREYREDMAKLETAFTTQGHSAEAAKDVYKDFYAILGESDRSVEAANHLAELTSNQQELTQWSTIAAGVTAKFGDSLPIEGLTEAANETAKLGEVTGPLADALNWAGISEDDFNAKLAECNSEQERATLITETLNGLYAEAAAEYNELTASAQDARTATAEMEEAQANIGAAIEPVTTAWTRLKTQGLEAITPAIEKVAGAIQDATTWLEEHETAATIIKAVVIALAAAFGVFAIALGIAGTIQLVTAAMASLGTVMAFLTSPITLVIAAVAALVAGFLYLWSNCEGFRNFWIGLWEAIKSAASAVAEWFVGAWGAAAAWATEAWADVSSFFGDLWAAILAALQPAIAAVQNAFSAAWSFILAVWQAVLPYFSALWAGIQAVFSVVVAVLGGFFKAAWTTIKGIWSVVVSFFATVWAGIQAVFSVVASILGGFFSVAWSAIKGVWSVVVSYFSAIWNSIAGVFSVAESVLSGDFSAAWAAIQGILGEWAGFFGDIWDACKDVFGDALDIGSKIVNDIRAGIEGAWDSLASWFSGLFDSVFGNLSANISVGASARGGNIPQHETGLSYVPYDDYLAYLHRGERVLTAEENKAYTQMARASVSTSGASVGRSFGRPETGFADLARAVGIQTAGISSLSSEYRRGSGSMRPVVIELDGRELGRAVVNVGNLENSRVGAKLAVGGAL